MAYNRLWFANDKYALTLGAGMINNPGRYLVLIPPIQTSQTGASGGASATNPALDSNGNPYFSQNPGDEFRAWDASATFDYMPNEYITFRSEYIHREANVGYFAGPGGVTSPDGLNTTAQPSGWKPDLVNTEDRINLAMMVRF